MNLIRVGLRIEGRVQGVGFRASATRQAQILGLSGEVWNTEDDAVEAWAEGPPDQVESFVRWCEVGPGRARVRSVSRKGLPAEGGAGFQIRR